MASAILTHRLARREDIDPLKALMDAAISELQKPFLNESQIASSRTIIGLDTQLIDVGDSVNVAGTSGKVSAMSLVSTTLRTENQVITIPNSSIWGGIITNESAAKPPRPIGG
jgi:hypothetical protein